MSIARSSLAATGQVPPPGHPTILLFVFNFDASTTGEHLRCRTPTDFALDWSTSSYIVRSVSPLQFSKNLSFFGCVRAGFSVHVLPPSSTRSPPIGVISRMTTRDTSAAMMIGLRTPTERIGLSSIWKKLWFCNSAVVSTSTDASSCPSTGNCLQDTWKPPTTVIVDQSCLFDYREDGGTPESGDQSHLSQSDVLLAWQHNQSFLHRMTRSSSSSFSHDDSDS